MLGQMAQNPVLLCSNSCVPHHAQCLLSWTRVVRYSAVTTLFLHMQIELLSLQDNNMDGSLPSNWSTMQAIMYLGLESNALTGSLPDSWSNFTNVSLVTCLYSTHYQSVQTHVYF